MRGLKAVAVVVVGASWAADERELGDTWSKSVKGISVNELEVISIWEFCPGVRFTLSESPAKLFLRDIADRPRKPAIAATDIGSIAVSNNASDRADNGGFEREDHRG